MLGFGAYIKRVTPKKEEQQIMQQAIIRFEVQVTPQIHQGFMAHYWSVFRIDEAGNKFTLSDGWHQRLYAATVFAEQAARKYM